MNELPKDLTTEQIRVYLMGKALQGAYNNLEISRKNLSSRPGALASHITETVNQLIKGFQ